MSARPEKFTFDGAITGIIYLWSLWSMATLDVEPSRELPLTFKMVQRVFLKLGLFVKFFELE